MNLPFRRLKPTPELEKVAIIRLATFPLIYNKKGLFPQIHGYLNGMVSDFIFRILGQGNMKYWYFTNQYGE